MTYSEEFYYWWTGIRSQILKAILCHNLSQCENTCEIYPYDVGHPMTISVFKLTPKLIDDATIYLGGFWCRFTSMGTPHTQMCSTQILTTA